ncbi:MAG TPA: glycosyltransferase family A protein [Candidatus Sulfotelmatobacter sp.]|nr:glycosyltransferase family A protein [Candidatus Sulfotelmatobacter sp.]HWI55924.1 glycosyltransferase family A protein [Bacillota bacterium]
MSRYIIITPAHNEEAFIARTAESIIAQTVRPFRWIVVNDASTDRTGQIVGQYASRHGFIQLLNVERPAGRHFGNKVRAFNLGLTEARKEAFDFIGNLDADISFEANYFERILREFGNNPKLGLAGGLVCTRVGAAFVSQKVALDSVAGAVQLFRRECFDQVGGYIPLPNGGIDAAAEVSARMHGWETRTFPEYRVLEHRLTGSARARPLGSRLNEGRRMYSLGYSYHFFIVRCVYRTFESPWVLGSLAALFGYFDSLYRGRPVMVPPEVVHFLRGEQNQKLKRLLRLPVWLKGADAAPLCTR